MQGVDRCFLPCGSTLVWLSLLVALSACGREDSASATPAPVTGPENAGHAAADVLSDPDQPGIGEAPQPDEPTASTTPIRHGIELDVQASPSHLRFQWTSDSETAVNRLWQIDPDDPAPELVKEFTGQRDYDWSLEIDPLALDWRDATFEMDVCEASECRTSLSQPIAPLVDQSAHALASAPDQPTGQAPLQAIALDGTGRGAWLCSGDSIAVQFRLSTGWALADPVHTAKAPKRSADSATCQLAVSIDGNTLVQALERNGQYQLNIFERLGEGWFGTASLDVPTAGTVGTYTQLFLDRAGDRALLAVVGDPADTAQLPDTALRPDTRATAINLHWFERATRGWRSREQQVQAESGPVVALTTGPDMASLNWLATNDAGGLSLVQAPLQGKDARRTLALPELAAHPDTRLASAAEGDRLLVAGWASDEPGTLQVLRLQGTESSTPAIEEDSAVPARVPAALPEWLVEYRTTVASAQAGGLLTSLQASGDLQRAALNWHNGERRLVRVLDGFELRSTVALEDELALSAGSQPAALSDDGRVLMLGHVATDQNLQALAFHRDDD